MEIMEHTPQRKQGILTAHGLEVRETIRFFKPSDRPQTVTITGVTPFAPPKVKTVTPKDGPSYTIDVLAELAVTVQGAPHIWEVSAGGLAAAINAHVTDLPATVEVIKHGNGKKATFTVRDPAPAPAPGPRKVVSKGNEAPRAACIVDGCAIVPAPGHDKCAGHVMGA